MAKYSIDWILKGPGGRVVAPNKPRVVESPSLGNIFEGIMIPNLTNLGVEIIGIIIEKAPESEVDLNLLEQQNALSS